MTERTPRPRAAVLTLLLVAVAIACALWLARSGDRGGKTRRSPDQSLSVAMEGLTGRGSKSSDADRWLDDLASSDKAAPAVEWVEPQDLVSVASALLERYERIDSAALETQGYLDLKGNVWGAMVSDRRGWVDMVTVMSNEADDQTTVRVVRLVADRLGRS